MSFLWHLKIIFLSLYMRGRRGRDGMVLDLQLPVQSVPIITKVVSSNPIHGEVYSIELRIKNTTDTTRSV
jgi:hypothetical protein